ncbi:hypothetical protein [Arthrobacter sp. IK3]|uniref:hypothetical protein n=1 Tax=Arthrobacter sp. IK3 TaxID=3448169 RepID=UPI003EE299F9
MNILEITATWQFAAILLAVGAGIIVLAFMMRSGAPVPAPAQQAQPESPVLSQVGFVEVDGRVLPFRSVVRQSTDLTDQQLEIFRRNLIAQSYSPVSR